MILEVAILNVIPAKKLRLNLPFKRHRPLFLQCLAISLTNYNVV
jgi:hypothetical protein